MPSYRRKDEREQDEPKAEEAMERKMSPAMRRKHEAMEKGGMRMGNDMGGGMSARNPMPGPPGR